jgi:hypothetical protein
MDGLTGYEHVLDPKAQRPKANILPWPITPTFHCCQDMISYGTCRESRNKSVQQTQQEALYVSLANNKRHQLSLITEIPARVTIIYL